MSIWGFSLYRIYELVPWMTAIVVLWTFVLRCGLSFRAKTAWVGFVILACSRMLAYRSLGGSALCPTGLPEWFVHGFDIAFFGTIALGALSVPLYCWKSRVKAWLLPVIAYAAAAAGVCNACAAPVVMECVVSSDRIPPSLDGYRIVQVSDIHAYCGCRRRHTQGIVDVANGLRPDLVCLTGDYAEGDPRECARYLEPLLGLSARDGVYAVTGNHEFGGSDDAVRDWAAYYERWGIPFLKNSCVVLRRALALGGVDDDSVCSRGKALGVRGRAPDVTAAFSSATNGEYRVLLQHTPEKADSNIARNRVGLQLSGHFHGGFMPGIRDILERKGNRLHGLFAVGDGALCVSAGCGPWGGLPLRYCTPSEIGLIVLRSAGASSTRR